MFGPDFNRISVVVVFRGLFFSIASFGERVGLCVSSQTGDAALPIAGTSCARRVGTTSTFPGLKSISTSWRVLEDTLACAGLMIFLFCNILPSAVCGCSKSKNCGFRSAFLCPFVACKSGVNAPVRPRAAGYLFSLFSQHLFSLLFFFIYVFPSEKNKSNSCGACALLRT
jgi:hypothetical protein